MSYQSVEVHIGRPSFRAWLFGVEPQLTLSLNVVESDSIATIKHRGYAYASLSSESKGEADAD